MFAGFYSVSGPVVYQIGFFTPRGAFSSASAHGPGDMAHSAKSRPQIKLGLSMRAFVGLVCRVGCGMHLLEVFY